MMETKHSVSAAVIVTALDNVAVATRELPSGFHYSFGTQELSLEQAVRQGERFALKDLKRGAFVVQYGQPFARSKGIRKGETITADNTVNKIPGDSKSAFKPPPRTCIRRELAARTFMGYRRRSGLVGTRNYYVIIPTSMCSSEVAVQTTAALEADQTLWRRYPHIDGIRTLAHTEGCGCDSALSIDRLQRVLKNHALHPNVGGCLWIDLGCEQTNQSKMQSFLNSIKGAAALEDKPMDWITIQECGGVEATISSAKGWVRKRLPLVNKAKRELVSIGNLVLGTECGASDSFSGITANPLIGEVADRIVYAGGSAILTEITEMLGTFNMFLPRFRSLKVAGRFKAMLDWYEDLASRLGTSLEPNLVPQNIEGGLLNNYIKSLGAVMKGGTTPVEDVLDYGERIRRKGLSIMQGPGNDPESLTGIVSSGANIVCFSTGKGAISGSAICPVIKITSNSKTFRRMSSDMDFDAGSIIEENVSMTELGDELWEQVLRVVSGELTKTELSKQRQFQIWTAGKLSL